VTPFFFGERDRRLYGIFDPAERGQKGRPRAVLICEPWGPDYTAMHGVLRRLALNLAQSGHNILRFDYFGVGDSAGESDKIDLDGWRRDIEMAIDELKSMAAVQRITLLGVRLGASLAAEVCAARNDVNALVLWDPVIKGEDYLVDLETAHLDFIERRTRHFPLPPTDVRHRACYPFPEKFELGLRKLDLTSLFPKLRQKILIVITERLASCWDLLELGGQARARFSVKFVSDRAPWRQNALGWDGVMPTEAMKEIANWLS
jgi:uncharacterized protein